MAKKQKNREKTDKRDKRLDNLKRDAGPGRPLGQRNYATIYRAALIKLAEINKKTPEELEDEILSKGLLSARNGDYRFYKDLQDRLHGTAVQKTDITTDGKAINESKIKNLVASIFQDEDKQSKT